MRRARPRLHLWLAFAATVVLLAAGTPVIRGEGPDDPPVRVIFPQDECVLESGKFELLCMARQRGRGPAAPPELRVDGEPTSWEPYAAPLLLSRLELGPGRHEIMVGPQKLEVYVRADPDSPGAPPDWSVYRDHPSQPQGRKDCATCHKLTKEDGRTVVGDLLEPSPCSQCHSSIDFELTHFHPEEPLAACHTCHALHGSGRPSLLKAPVKTLCAECHD